MGKTKHHWRSRASWDEHRASWDGNRASWEEQRASWEGQQHEWVESKLKDGGGHCGVGAAIGKLKLMPWGKNEHYGMALIK